MADPILTITDTSDVAKAGATIALGKVAPGATSLETTERVHNDLAAAGTDDARDLVLVVLARTSGTVYTRAGVDLLESRGVQVKIIKLNGVAVTEPFVNLGTGISIRLPDLPSTEFHEYTVRVLPRAGASEVVTDFKIAFEQTRFITIANPAAVAPGIQRGVGQGIVTAILSRSVAIGVTGIGTFQWPDYAWVYQGIPLSVLDHDETISDVDGSASTLIAGESYAYRAVLNETTTTIIKGDKVTGTAVFADLPALPVGNRFLGWGVRDFTADLTFIDLDSTVDFFNVTTSGLNATIARAGAGASMITSGKLIDPTTPVVVTMTASSTNSVQLLQDGSAAVTLDGSLFEAGAQFLADIVTDGSGETSRVERRKWQRSKTIVFDFGMVSNNQEAIWRNTTSRTQHIRSDMVSAQITATLGADTAGLLKFDLLIKEDGVAEVTAFTSQGSDDRRPGWDFGDTNQTDFGLPEVLAIPPNAALVARAAFTLDVSTPDPVVLVVEVDEE